MWWPSPFWYEGTVTAATTTSAARWALAGGFIDPRPDTETYLLVANPGAVAANVTFDVGGLPSSTVSRCRPAAATRPASRACVRRWPTVHGRGERHHHQRRAADRGRAVDLLVDGRPVLGRRRLHAADAAALSGGDARAFGRWHRTFIPAPSAPGCGPGGACRMLGDMVRFRSACLLAAALATVPFVPTLAADDPAARWWAHVSFLASDDAPGPRHRQRGPQEGRRLRRRAVQGRGPGPGRHLGLPAAGPLHVADDRRGAVEPGAGPRRQGRTGRPRRRTPRSRCASIRRRRSRRRSPSSATACRSPS